MIRSGNSIFEFLTGREGSQCSDIWISRHGCPIWQLDFSRKRYWALLRASGIQSQHHLFIPV